MTALMFGAVADCPDCGVRWAVVVTGSYRVNKSSLRPIGHALTMTMPNGNCTHGAPEALNRVQPDEKSAASIAAIRRLRGWPA